MTSLHALSPCCQVRSIRYGNRRRQCVRCRRTWRPRHRRHGRPRKRIHADRAIQYLRGMSRPIMITAQQRRVSAETIRADRRRSRDIFLRHRWLAVPCRGRLVCIADALAQRIGGRWYTVYFILIRPLHNTTAIIMPPLLRLGHEGIDGWNAAFSQLPPTVRLRIIALISDGHQALRGIALQRQLHIQRCHFHLKLGLANYLSVSVYSRQRIRALLIYQAIDRIITSTDTMAVTRSILSLRHLYRCIRAHGTRKVLRGFLKYWKDYRTYLCHPHLHLPTTSNTAESLIQSVRDIQYRARGFRTRKRSNGGYKQFVYRNERSAAGGLTNQLNLLNPRSVSNLKRSLIGLLRKFSL